MNSIQFPEMNYKHFREKNAKFHIFLLLSIIGGIYITIYDRKFRDNRPEEGLPKMITYISPINMVAEDNHLYFTYKSHLGSAMPCQDTCFLGCRLRIWNPFLGSESEIRFFPDFLPIFIIKRQWGTRGESGVSGGGGKPNIEEIVKKIGQKFS